MAARSAEASAALGRSPGRSPPLRAAAALPLATLLRRAARVAPFLAAFSFLPLLLLLFLALRRRGRREDDGNHKPVRSQHHMQPPCRAAAAPAPSIPGAAASRV